MNLIVHGPGIHCGVQVVMSKADDTSGGGETSANVCMKGEPMLSPNQGLA